MLLQDSMVVLEKLKKLFLIKRRNTIIKGRLPNKIFYPGSRKKRPFHRECFYVTGTPALPLLRNSLKD